MASPTADLPESLTRCATCGCPFAEPVVDWDDYFTELEDAAFDCARCDDLERWSG